MVQKNSEVTATLTGQNETAMAKKPIMKANTALYCKTLAEIRFSSSTDHKAVRRSRKLETLTAIPVCQKISLKDSIVLKRKNAVKRVITKPTAEAALNRAIVRIMATEKIFPESSRAYCPSPNISMILRRDSHDSGSRM